MFYDLYKGAFSYYCDQAVMPYEIMNAVAMKYVMTFRCCDFFVDSSTLAKVSNSDKDQPVSPDAPDIRSSAEAVVENNRPFAKFKTYNAAAKRSEMPKEKEKTINGFLHLGPVRNWSVIEKPKRVNPLNGFKTDAIPSNSKLSYLEYKLLNK